MIGEIYITGQIGNTYDGDGNITEKGVELIDVIEQLSKCDGAERVNVIIKSQGGYVEVGKQIAEVIKTIPNCYTRASELCASIATEIHLSVDLPFREIEEGTTYMIHNPLFQNLSGDSNYLKSMSESIKKTETEMEAMYAKATGLTKEVISGLMQIETYLTAEQAVSLKFASKVVKKEYKERKAIALMSINKNVNMSKTISERCKLALAILAGTSEPKRNALAMEIVTDKGTLVTPFDDLVVGDEALIDGVVAPDDSYLAENGQTIIVVNGMISEILEPAEDEGNEDESLARISELETALASLTTENSELKTTSEMMVAKLEELASKGSTFKTPAQAVAFRKIQVPVKQTYEERKAELKNKTK